MGGSGQTVSLSSCSISGNTVVSSCANTTSLSKTCFTARALHVAVIPHDPLRDTGFIADLHCFRSLCERSPWWLFSWTAIECKSSSFITSITPHTPHLVYPAFYFIGMSSHRAEQKESKSESQIDFICLMTYGHFTHHLHCFRSLCERSPWWLFSWAVIESKSSSFLTSITPLLFSHLSRLTHLT